MGEVVALIGRVSDQSERRRTNLTKRFLESIVPGRKDLFFWDSRMLGFGVRIKPSGCTSFVIQYRNGDFRTRRMVIGKYPVLAIDQARSLAQQHLAAVRAGKDPSAERQQRRRASTVSAACDRYLSEYAAVHKKPSSAAEDSRLIEKRIRPGLGTLKIDSVGAADVSRLHTSLRSTPYEANRTVAVLSKIFSLCEGPWGLRSQGSNPCKAIRRYPESRRIRHLTADELQRIGAALAEAQRTGAEDPAVVLAIRLLAFTGCRLGEVRNLRWADVDLERGQFFLRDAKAGPRTVPIGGRTVELLREAPRNGQYVLARPGADCALAESTLEGAWRRLRTNAGVEDARLHDFRHTVGTIAGTEIQVSAFLVRDILGHKTMAMTNGYVGQAFDPQRMLADAVSAIIAERLAGPAVPATVN